MKNVWIVLLFMVSQFNYACNCAEYNKVRKEALRENKFMLVHFTNIFTYEEADLDATPIMNPAQQSDAVKELLKNYKYVCVTDDINASLIRKYNIKSFPQLLLIDGNGIEIYRFTDIGNSTEFVNVLENFVIPNDFLNSEMANYNKRKSYATAMRLAQKYLDYSLLIDPGLKQGVFAATKNYLEKAEELLPKRDEKCKENFQKLCLLQLSQLAYQKNFSFLNEKLDAYDEDAIFESNATLYYFLKYITAKALQQDEFPQIEKTTLSIDGFEYFRKKSDLILNGQTIAQTF